MSGIIDDNIRLLFFCCHPDLPGKHQITLALRLVCALTTDQIANALLTDGGEIEELLAEAIEVVADGEIAAGLPVERLEAATLVLYLLFNEGYATGSVLCEHAIRLVRYLAQRFPDDPEVLALLALFLLQHARAPARFDAEGRAVLLDDQERSRWDHAAIAEGIALVAAARQFERLEVFQLQASIAAAHGCARTAAETPWVEIEMLYAELEALQPSPVITLNRAVAVWKVRGADAALAIIEPLAERLDSYFHFFGLKGGLLRELGRVAEARTVFERALALAKTPTDAEHVRLELARLA